MDEVRTRAFIDEIRMFEKLRNPYIVNFIGKYASTALIFLFFKQLVSIGASMVPGKLAICTELLQRGTVWELIRKAKVICVSRRRKKVLIGFSVVGFVGVESENGVGYYVRIGVFA